MSDADEWVSGVEVAEITFEELKEYFASRPADEYAGTTRNGYSCPLATYMEQAKEWRTPGVGTYDVIYSRKEGIYMERRRVALPYWAQTFVRKVDETFQFGGPVTAGECLKVLTDIEILEKGPTE